MTASADQLTSLLRSVRSASSSVVIRAQLWFGGLLEQHNDLAADETRFTSSSRRVVRSLLQSDSDVNTTGSSFNLQVVITLAILICVMLCIVALQTLVKHLRVYRQCDNADHGSYSEKYGVRSQAVESLGSEKGDLECMSVVSYSNYKSPLQSVDECSECAICLGEFGRGEEQRVLPNCKHSFHSQCIAMWLSCSHTSCPTCRDEIVTRPGTPGSTCSHGTSFSGDIEGMLRSDIIAFRRSPRLMISSPAFRSSSLFTMLSEEDSRPPTMLFAEALTPSPYVDYYSNR